MGPHHLRRTPLEATPNVKRALFAGALAAGLLVGATANAMASPQTATISAVSQPTVKCGEAVVDANGQFTLTCTVVQPTPTPTPTATSTPTPGPTGTSTPAPTTPAPTTSTTTSTTTTTTRPPTSTTTTTRPPTAGPAVLRAVDGGLGWYGQFASPLPTDPNFFPIGVWFESVLGTGDINVDKAVGLNTYIQLTANSNFALARTNGMYVISDNETTTSSRNGWNIGDEVDMTSGENGDVVLRNHMQTLANDGKLRYTNVGKGVLFWQSDTEAAQFMNLTDPHTGRPVLVSYDVYWMTDDDACQQSQGGELLGLNRALSFSECHLAANYGRSIDRLRALDAGHDPVWGFVEVGRPGSTAPRAITPAQIKAAVWSTLIHGARGIAYFNHSFSGPCQTQHALRDGAVAGSCYAPVRAAVTTVNNQIRALAPVLNAPFADNVAAKSGPADLMTKWHNDHFFLFAGANTAAGGNVVFNAPCIGNATVTVLDEGRTIPMVNGQFTDAFANGDAYHLYRVDGGNRCGL